MVKGFAERKKQFQRRSRLRKLKIAAIIMAAITIAALTKQASGRPSQIDPIKNIPTVTTLTNQALLISVFIEPSKEL